jgi:hypothetical protein
MFKAFAGKDISILEMSFSFDEMKPKRMAIPRMISNELLGLGKDKPASTGPSSLSSGAGKKVEKKLSKKEQAKADAKKASTIALATLLAKEPTVARVREFVCKRIKELTED